MKCPFCSENMNEGFINSRMDITFTKEKVAPGEDPTSDSEAIFLPEESRFNEDNKAAYYCTSCERVVVKPNY